MQRNHENIHKSKKQRLCCHGNTCWQVLLKANELLSMYGFVMQRIHNNIDKSNKQKKSVAMATLVARYCHKANQLQSMQRYGMQRTHRYIYKSKKQKNCVSMAILIKLKLKNNKKGGNNDQIKREKQQEKCYHGNSCWQLLPKTK